MDSAALRGRVVATPAIICQSAIISANPYVVRIVSTASAAHLKFVCATRVIVLPILGMNASPSARLIASMDIASRQTNAPATPTTNLPKAIVRASASLFAIQVVRTVSACSPTYAVVIRAIVHRRVLRPKTCVTLSVILLVKQTEFVRGPIFASAKTVIAWFITTRKTFRSDANRFAASNAAMARARRRISAYVSTATKTRKPADASPSVRPVTTAHVLRLRFANATTDLFSWTRISDLEYKILRLFLKTERETEANACHIVRIAITVSV